MKFPIITDKDVNLVIITDHAAFKQNIDLIPTLFGNLEWGKDINWEIDEEGKIDIFDVLAKNGFFPSKTEARKNWKRTGSEIPDGWTEILGVGKLKRNIFIWKPVWCQPISFEVAQTISAHPMEILDGYEPYW